MPRLFSGEQGGRPLALGIDVRNRDFSETALVEVVDQLALDPSVRPEVVYLDCRTDVLQRRYSETRRRHPLRPEEAPLVGIEAEIALLSEIRARSDILIDTSDMSPHDLEAYLALHFAPDGLETLAVTVESFSYKRGIPRGADMVFDCRFLRNPYWDGTLRSLDGRDERVANHVAGDPAYCEYRTKFVELTEFLLPSYRREGKAHFTIAFGCTGGRHRSVALTESLSVALAVQGWQVSKRHRELERTAETLQRRQRGTPA